MGEAKCETAHLLDDSTDELVDCKDFVRVLQHKSVSTIQGPYKRNKDNLDTKDGPRLILKDLLFNLIGEETLALNQKHLVMVGPRGSGTFIP